MDNTKVVLSIRVNLGFSLNYLVFYCKFCAFKIILVLHGIFLIFFIQKQINQTYAITSLTFQVSKMDLTTYLAQLVSTLEGKNMFFNFWTLLLKMHILRL